MKTEISKEWSMGMATKEVGQNIEAGGPTLTKEQWLARCAAVFREKAEVTPELAMSLAESQLENCDYDLTESPEDAADEEMSNWTD